MNPTILRRIEHMMLEPETVPVYNRGMFPEDTNCFSTAMYALGLTEKMVPAEGSIDILSLLIDGSKSHSIKELKESDLVIWEGPAPFYLTRFGPVVYTHAAVYLGDNVVFHQDGEDGPVTKAKLHIVNRPYSKPARAHASEDLERLESGIYRHLLAASAA